MGKGIYQGDNGENVDISLGQWEGIWTYILLDLGPNLFSLSCFYVEFFYNADNSRCWALFLQWNPFRILEITVKTCVNKKKGVVFQGLKFVIKFQVGVLNFVVLFKGHFPMRPKWKYTLICECLLL